MKNKEFTEKGLGMLYLKKVTEIEDDNHSHNDLLAHRLKTSNMQLIDYHNLNCDGNEKPPAELDNVAGRPCYPEYKNTGPTPGDNSEISIEGNFMDDCEIYADGTGGCYAYVSSYNQFEILDISNPNPITTKVIDKTIQGDQSQNISFNTFGVEGSNTAIIEFSTIPAINFSGRLEYLIQYPFGCVEQTTSSVFPQLFLNDIFDLTSKKKRQIQTNIENGINRLGKFQKANA